MWLKSGNPDDDNLNGGMAEENPPMAETVGSDEAAQFIKILSNGDIINNIILCTYVNGVKIELTDFLAIDECVGFW